MKRVLILLIAAVLSLGLMTACEKGEAKMGLEWHNNPSSKEEWMDNARITSLTNLGNTTTAFLYFLLYHRSTIFSSFSQSRGFKPIRFKKRCNDERGVFFTPKNTKSPWNSRTFVSGCKIVAPIWLPLLGLVYKGCAFVERSEIQSATSWRASPY